FRFLGKRRPVGLETGSNGANELVEATAKSSPVATSCSAQQRASLCALTYDRGLLSKFLMRYPIELTIPPITLHCSLRRRNRMNCGMSASFHWPAFLRRSTPHP